MAGGDTRLFSNFLWNLNRTLSKLSSSRNRGLNSGQRGHAQGSVELCLLKSCITRTLADLSMTTPCQAEKKRKPLFQFKRFVTENCILEDAAKLLFTRLGRILNPSGVLEPLLPFIPDRHCIPGSSEQGHGIYKPLQQNQCSSDHLPFWLPKC